MSGVTVPALRFSRIEEPWEPKKLGDIASLIGGYAFPSGDMTSEPTDRQVVKMSNIYKGRLNLNRNSSFISHVPDAAMKVQLRHEDILLSLTGTFGKRDFGYTVILKKPEGLFLNQRIGLIRTDTLKASAKLLSVVTETNNFQNLFHRLAIGGTGNQANVSLADCRNINIFLPSLSEQEKIAAFLSEVDGKLVALKTQLAGWRDFKRGMMQALFSQLLRFKADNGSEFSDWEIVKLEDKFSFHKTNSLSRAVLGLEKDGIKNIHYGDIHTKYRAQFDISQEATGIIPKHLSDKAGEPLQKGDVIFADASEDYNDVGKAIEVINLNNHTVVGGLHTIVARPKKDTITLGFAAYLFASWPLRKQLMRIANGASVLGISKTNLAKVELTLPSLPEQQKITDALSAIDTKIEALTARLDATREFKRGLLQKMFV